MRHCPLKEATDQLLIDAYSGDGVAEHQIHLMGFVGCDRAIGNLSTLRVKVCAATFENRTAYAGICSVRLNPRVNRGRNGGFFEDIKLAPAKVSTAGCIKVVANFVLSILSLCVTPGFYWYPLRNAVVDGEHAIEEVCSFF